MNDDQSDDVGRADSSVRYDNSYIKNRERSFQKQIKEIDLILQTELFDGFTIFHVQNL